MNEELKRAEYEKYLRATHRLGRIAIVLTLVMLVGAPFVIGAYLDAMPDLVAFAHGFMSIGLVYFITCVAEYLIYVPMLGAGGSYLAFITGNLVNMKIPCAVNARDIVGAKSGTAENEIISTLSIATSSLVTTLVLTLGVIMMIPLQPLLQSPTLRPAFDNVVPALFGAMACKYYRGHLKIAVFPLAIMTLLFTLAPSLADSTSIMIIPSGAITIGLSYLYYRRDARASETELQL